MSVTIDITGLPHERIVFGPSPLAELGAALHALAEPAHHAGLTRMDHLDIGGAQAGAGRPAA